MSQPNTDRVDYRARYQAPFLIETEVEGSIYTKFSEKNVTSPRYLDWNLIRNLKLESKVVNYLKTLGLDYYAKNVDFSGYEELAYEFLTTVVVCGDKKKPKISVRMGSEKFVVNLSKMKSVFRFPIGGERVRPLGYNANIDWEDLTGFGNWDSSGMPAGYIKDPALSIVHKFIAYNISGKEQANKVNTTEVFLLSCAKKGIKVCISFFIWSAMIQMKTRPTSHASFCPIITGLAHNFGVLSSTKGEHDEYEEIEPHYIDFSELKGAQIISDEVTILPAAKRQCVEKFLNKEIAQGKLPRVPDMDVGSSNPMDEDEDEEGEGEEDGQDNQPIPNDIHSQFSSFRNHLDTCLTSLTNDIHSQFSSFRNDVNARFDAQDQQFSSFRNDVNARFDAQDQQFSAFRNDVEARFDAQHEQIAAMQAQWNAWSGFNPPPPPPPPPAE
ncbi:hypothetical protein OROGR_031985 [Orobanche gracilis]